MTTDIYKHKESSFERLNSTNYPNWAMNIEYLLSSLSLWTMCNGDRPRLALLANGSQANRDARAAYVEEFNDDCPKCVNILYNSCSEDVRHIIRGMNDPRTMWTTLQAALDSTASQIGRAHV